MVSVPEPMGNKQFFGLCAFTRSWEGLKLCQNVARVSPGGVKGLDLGLGMFTYLAPCMVSVASSPCCDPPKLMVFFLGINRFDPTNFSKFQHSQITGAHNAVGAPGGGHGSGRDIAWCCKRQRQNVTI